MSELEAQAQSAANEIEQADSIDALEAIRVRLLGKAGLITEQLKRLGALERFNWRLWEAWDPV